MSNVANRQWPHNQSPAGWPTTTNAAQPTTQPYPVVRMPTVPPAAAEILRDAVFHIDAAEHQASGASPKTVRNLGWGGAALNARSGSTTVADTNDPLHLGYWGTSYLYLPGIAGNSLTCTAPATATQYLATALNGATASGAATGGTTFTFSTTGSWATVSLLDAGSAIVASFIGANLTTGSATAQTDTYAVAWAINRATSGRKSVAVVAPVWLFGTDDWMSVFHHELLNANCAGFTVLLFNRPWPTQANSMHWIAKRRGGSSTLPGYAFIVTSASIFAAYICDGIGPQVSAQSAGLSFNGSSQMVVDTVDYLSHSNSLTVGGKAAKGVTPPGILTNPEPLRVGCVSSGGGYSDMEFMSAAIFRRALSASEIATLTDYYQGKYA